MGNKETREKLAAAGVNPVVLQMLYGPRPYPKDGVILETEQTSINESGIPQYTVTQINKVDANEKTLVPIVRSLAPKGILRGRVDEVSVLADNKVKYIPDYSGNYLSHEQLNSQQSSVVRDVVGEIEQKSVDTALEQLSRKLGKAAMDNVKVEETSKQTRKKVEQLVGSGHEIGATYRANDMLATEVFPRVQQRRLVDPVLCVMMFNDKRGMNRQLNTLLEGAFVTAMVGRINQETPRLRDRMFDRAALLGSTAGKVAYSNCLADTGWKLGELMLLLEVVKGKGDVLINGFTNLKNRRRH